MNPGYKPGERFGTSFETYEWERDHIGQNWTTLARVATSFAHFSP
jgi:hypothetical protein